MTSAKAWRDSHSGGELAWTQHLKRGHITNVSCKPDNLDKEMRIGRVLYPLGPSAPDVASFSEPIRSVTADDALRPPAVHPGRTLLDAKKDGSLVFKGSFC